MEEVKKTRPREKDPADEEKLEPVNQELEIEEESIKEEEESGVSIPRKEWTPKTELGRKVLNGEITNIDEILDRGQRILEPEIVDYLLPELSVELLEVGQSKGKFGGGKGSIWKQTQKKTPEGNKLTFTTCALVGHKSGYVGIGFAGARETVPAREKATRKAKLNIIKVKKGCGDWACGCKEYHSIPYKTEGKESSVRIVLFPAPKGAGLKVEKKCFQMLKAAGIKDVYSKTYGKTGTKMNLVKACYDALKNLSQFKELPKIEAEPKKVKS